MWKTTVFNIRDPNYSAFLKKNNRSKPVTSRWHFANYYKCLKVTRLFLNINLNPKGKKNFHPQLFLLLKPFNSLPPLFTSFLREASPADLHVGTEECPILWTFSVKTQLRQSPGEQSCCLTPGHCSMLRLDGHGHEAPGLLISVTLRPHLAVGVLLITSVWRMRALQSTDHTEVKLEWFGLLPPLSPQLTVNPVMGSSSGFYAYAHTHEYSFYAVGALFYLWCDKIVFTL